MTTAELRAKYLAFFESKGHTIYPSGSLVPYDVTGRLDESLLFNGAGMVQFKPYFRGVAQPSNKRLTTAQKCVRTGDIDSVGDASHLTFFEMLGNFSFGAYFKEEAIAFSWEFLTSEQWLGLDPKRLAFTVFEEDDEALGYWTTWLSEAGLDASRRVFKLSEETNYWPAGAFSNGPPGPCGPNSEMFYWVPNDVPPPSGAYSAEDFVRDEEQGKWLEIWNDVFIQYEWQGELNDPARPSDGYRKTGMPALPFQSIDTGMGLERTVAVISGFSSVYDTETFQSLFQKLHELGSPQYRMGAETDTALRIIADHARTACFCIADGVLPANNGRGYVLRRLIRRAVLKGSRQLNLHEGFFAQLCQPLVDSMGHHYHELVTQRDLIVETLTGEEALFRRTLNQGNHLLTEQIEAIKKEGRAVLSGPEAFKLYDTYGFPLEVTQEICAEAGIEVDQEGYEVAMKEAQERSRGAQAMDDVYGGVSVTIVSTLLEAVQDKTEFVGYDRVEEEARVLAVLPELTDDGSLTGRLGIALDRTPFYAESGGQVSDTGILRSSSGDFKVLDVIKQDGLFVHLVEPSGEFLAELDDKGPEPLQAYLNEKLFNQLVEAEIEPGRRMEITRNHTATHLLHAALRENLGTHVTQAGSLVAPDHLRFDFTHSKALTSDELERIERQVNEEVMKSSKVVMLPNIPIAEAKAMGAMALFGEKYGDRVRVVMIRDDEGAPVSIELCGGCHVGSTGQIGMFKIVSESSVASGIRRIEAITGERARAWSNELLHKIKQIAEALKSPEGEVLAAVSRLQDQLKEERKKREKLIAEGAGSSAETLQQGEVQLFIQMVKDISAKEAQGLMDKLVQNKPGSAALVILEESDKTSFSAKATAEATAEGFHCGNLIKAIAAATEGNGGGRPEFASGGAKKTGILDLIRSQAEAYLQSLA